MNFFFWSQCKRFLSGDLIPSFRYWPKLDDAIRAAAYRGVSVRLLVSHWKYSQPGMIAFLKSLTEINSGLQRRANQTGKIEVVRFGTIMKLQNLISLAL